MKPKTTSRETPSAPTQKSGAGQKDSAFQLTPEGECISHVPKEYKDDFVRAVNSTGQKEVNDEAITFYQTAPVPSNKSGERTQWSVKNVRDDWQIWDGTGPIATVEDEQDAHLIVRAVNSHEELLEVCRALLCDLESGYIAQHSVAADRKRDKHEQTMRAAIPKAEGRQ